MAKEIKATDTSKDFAIWYAWGSSLMHIVSNVSIPCKSVGKKNDSFAACQVQETLQTLLLSQSTTYWSIGVHFIMKNDSEYFDSSQMLLVNYVSESFVNAVGDHPLYLRWGMDVVFNNSKLTTINQVPYSDCVFIEFVVASKQICFQLQDRCNTSPPIPKCVISIANCYHKNEPCCRGIGPLCTFPNVSNSISWINSILLTVFEFCNTRTTN